jgi:hypothetical protein
VDRAAVQAGAAGLALARRVLDRERMTLDERRMLDRESAYIALVAFRVRFAHLPELAPLMREIALYLKRVQP